MQVLLIKTPYEVSFAGNPMPFVFTLSPYSDLQKTQDYKLQVNVLIEDTNASGIFVNAYSQVFFPDNDGLIQMDVRTILDAYLEYYIPKGSLVKPIECVDQTKKFYVTYQLQLADSLVTSLLSSAYFYALKGGLSYQEWNPVAFFQYNILSYKQPLHYAPAGEKVSLNQLMFFSWLYPFANKAAQSVIYTFYWHDQTSTTYTHPATLSSGKWSVNTIPATFNRLAIPPNGKTLVYYTIHIMAGAVQVTVPYNYIIDYRVFYEEYFLLYRNSLGAVDTLRLRGQVDIDADYTYQQASQISPANYFASEILLPQVIQSPNEEVQKLTGDTGFISKAALNNLRDLFLSKQIFHWIDEQYLPAVLLANTAKLYTNKNSLFSLQVQWRHAFSDEFYTPPATVPFGITCPAVELLNVEQVNKNTLQIVWSLQIPYDKIQVTINNGSTIETFIYFGNSGSVLQTFTNPAVSAPVDIIITAKTVCDLDTNPIYVGPATTITVSVNPNSKPIAVNDTFSINGGFSTPVTLTGNVLDNDYDPDGDAIECSSNSGFTNKGGSFFVHTDGTVSYTPPGSTFTGQDYFQYRVHEVADPTSISNLATIYVNVGGSTFVKVFVRLVLTDKQAHLEGDGRGYTTAKYYLKFYSDINGNTPLDVTGLGVVISVNKIEDYSGSHIITPQTFNATSTSLKIFDGIIFRYTIYPDTYTLTEELQAGDGYTVIQ